MSDRAIHPVYVDGPLKGRDFPVPAGSWHVQAVDYDADGIGLTALYERDGLHSLSTRTVTYTLRRFGFHSGDGVVMLWLGCSEPDEPDAGVLADLLLSDAAKAARCD